MKTLYMNSKTIDQYYLRIQEFLSLQQENEKTTRNFINIQNKLIEQVLPRVSFSANLQLFDKPNAVQPKTEHRMAADSIKRFDLKAIPVNAGKVGNPYTLPPEKAILVLESGPPMFTVVREVLSNLSNPVFHITPSKKFEFCAPNRIQLDFSSLDQIHNLSTELSKRVDGVCAVFNLFALGRAIRDGRLTDPLFVGDAGDQADFNTYDGEEFEEAEGLSDVYNLFRFLKVLHTDLKTSAHESAALLINLSFMDGQFGLTRKAHYPLGDAGTVGLVKAIARESSAIHIKCVDIHPSISAFHLINRLKQELFLMNDSVEVGLDGNNRWGLMSVEAPPPEKPAGPIDLNSESIVLATGGAYGIVAETVKALVQKTGCRLVIVGRSAFPEPESSATRHLTQPKEIRQFLIAENATAGSPKTPAQIVKLEKQILKARQIRSNFESMQRHSAGVEYHAFDIRDTERLTGLIDHVYKKYGRLDGVIHGAGVIEDKLVGQKSIESFVRVFDTKVIPALVFSRTLNPDTLKFLCFFSSVAARFGNRGQTDYCAANEILNKLAQRLDAKWAGRVFAINWGPWAAGMVGAGLRNAMTKRGISLIPVTEGVAFFLDELACISDRLPEVLISRQLEI